MPTSSERLYKSAPIVSAALLLIAAVYFGSSDGFGAYLLSFVILPRLFLAFVTCAIISVVQRKTVGHVIIAMLIALVSPGAYRASRHIADPAELMVWAAIHPVLLHNAMQKDGVVVWWNAWGMAGSENDSYLVYTIAVLSPLRRRTRSRS